MNEAKNDEYYVGIDLGTSSCGWAVTDTEYHLKRLKGKDAFGARLFAGGESAKARRIHRTTCRRLARRKYRVKLLNDCLASAITEKDPNFFLRLQYSNLDAEDKKKASNKSINPSLLFPTKKEEVNFYKSYPTIWHLRLALMMNDEAAFSDIRNVYFALHHIIKYRGNFLWEGKMNIEDPSALDEKLDARNELILQLPRENGENDEVQSLDGYLFSQDKYKELYNILEKSRDNKTVKQKQIKALIKTDDDRLAKYWELFAKSVTGGSFSPLNQDSDDKTKFDFEHFDDDKINDCQEKMGECYGIVEASKTIYDFFTLQSLIKGSEESEKIEEELNVPKKLSKTISTSMVVAYVEHGKDLAAAKHILFAKDKHDGKFKATDSSYYAFFKKKDEKHNYSGFVGVDSNVGKRKDNNTNDELIKFFTNKIVDLEQTTLDQFEYYQGIENDLAWLKKRIENKTFRRLISQLNTSVIPHQLHESELNRILNNASKYYPSVFNEETKQKISAIFKYRIPFYFGPLYGDKHSNVVRNDGYENVRITPYNIDKAINKDKTRQKFRIRLTGRCSYLHYETVLPKSSLDYEEYIILDRLNKVRINDRELNHEEKEKILSFILSRSKTTINSIVKYLSNQDNKNTNDIRLSKIDAQLPFAAPSHAYVKNNLNFLDRKNDHDRIEHIILLNTIYESDKRQLRKILAKEYPDFNKQQIRLMAGRNTSKWGRLSRKFLTGRHPIDEDGVIDDGTNVLEIRRNTNQNLRQVVNNPEYHFKDARKQINNTDGKESSKTTVDEILENVPAPFRRSIYQCLRILDEIKSVTKKDPAKIFFEVTREDLQEKEKTRTKSRRDQLNEELKSFKETEEELSDFSINLKKLKEELNGKGENKDNNNNSDSKDINDNRDGITDDRLRGKHLYLYFKQLGKDLYTGETIDLNDVMHESKIYDIDHIIPQSLIKDDSLDNLVLVNRDSNQHIKKDIYPIPSEIKTEKVLKLWRFLHKKGLRSDKKYNNLMRSSRLTEKEINDFVSRQINAVDYSNIALRDIVEELYPNSRVIFSKAQYPSEMRKLFGRPKIRELNDAHHARDAYLNIVCGNILSTEFSDEMVRRMYAEKKEELLFKQTNTRDDLNNKPEKSFNMVKRLTLRMCENNGALRQQCQRVYRKHSALLTYALNYSDPSFYNSNITSAKGKKKESVKFLVPVHNDPFLSNVEKYGGYDSASTQYRYLISYVEVKGKKETKRLEFLNVKNITAARYKNEDELKQQLIRELNEQNKSKIQFLTKVINGQKAIYNGMIAKLSSGNRLQMLRTNIQPLYLEGEFINEKYYKTYIQYLKFASGRISKLKEENKSIHLFWLDKEKGEQVIVSKEKNLIILHELQEISKNKYYSPFGFLQKIQSIRDEEFLSMNLGTEIEGLIALLTLFTTKPSENVNKFFPSLAKLTARYQPSLSLKHDITIVYDSFTGLYSRKVTYKL